MSRIDLMFDCEGDGCLAFGTSLEEDREEYLKDCGGDEEYFATLPPLVSHVSFEAEADTDESNVILLLKGLADLEINAKWGDNKCVLEKLVSKVFQAGMEYARSLQVSKNKRTEE